MSFGGALVITTLLLAPLFIGPLLGLGNQVSRGRDLVVLSLASGTDRLATAKGPSLPPRETALLRSPAAGIDRGAAPLKAEMADVGSLPLSADSPPASNLSGKAPTSADSAFETAYQDAVRSHVQHFVYYPQAAREDQIRGLVRVQFDVTRDGRLIDVWIGQSSGYDVLDEAALLVVRKAEPLPPIPPALPAQLEISLPLDFVPPAMSGAGRFTIGGGSSAGGARSAAGL